MSGAPLRLLTTPWTPTGAVALALSVSFSGGATGTLTSADAAHKTVGADGEIWCPVHLAQRVGARVRLWLFDAMTGDPALSPPGAATDIPLLVSLELAQTAGGTRWRLRLSGLESTPATDLVSVTLDNSSGAWSALGLCEEGTTRVVSASAGVVVIDGQWQPRTTWVYPDYSQDSGDRRTRQYAQTATLADGTVDALDGGIAEITRDLTLVAQIPPHAGPSRTVARFASWGTGRRSLTVKTADETVLSGMGEYLLQSSLIAEGDYIAVGAAREARRVKSVAGSTLSFWEAFPTSQDAAAGDEIRVISEAEAMRCEIARTGYLFVHGQDPATGTPRPGQISAYAPASTEEEDEPRDGLEAVFSVPISLVRRVRPGITLP